MDSPLPDTMTVIAGLIARLELASTEARMLDNPLLGKLIRAALREARNTEKESLEGKRASR